MATAMTDKGKNVLKILKFVLIAAVIAGAGYWFLHKPKDVSGSQTIGTVSLPDETATASLTGTAAVKLPFPKTSVTSQGNLLKINWQMMAWQAQNGVLYANGGTETTTGSLMEQAGIDATLVRQDDCSASEAAFIKYTNDLKSGATSDGMFITYMGSGIDNYINAISNAVKPLGADYQPEVFCVLGKSYGEDQVIGPVEVKNNKQLLRGKVLHGVKEDGDIDLGLKLAADNGIPINADPTTYDPQALNLSYAKDFLSAVEDYNNDLTQTRHLVSKNSSGKYVTTGQDTSVHIDMVATWTPGDVNTTKGSRGGVTIISTGIYKTIMPSITIGCKHFINTNRDAIVRLVAAVAKAGDQIRTFSDAKAFACGVGAKVWNEESQDYWLKYFNGVQQNPNLHLGGSMVYNLNDMANTFGLNNNRDVFQDIYNEFSKIHSQLYPDDYKTIMPYSQVVDKSITRSVMDLGDSSLTAGKALTVDYSSSSTDQEVVGTKQWSITFDLGKSTISSVSFATLNEIATELSAAGGTSVAVYGHTDASGNDAVNIPLSQARAQAVVDYLVKQKIEGPRFNDIQGFGSTKPIQGTDPADAKNRRVEIILKAN